MGKHRKNIGKVIYLGVCFMLLFSAFNAFQNMISDMFDRVHYNGLGQISVFVLYGVFGLSNLIAPTFLKKVGPR